MPFNYIDVTIVAGTTVIVILIALIIRAVFKNDDNMELNEFNTWLNANKISKKKLSDEIGVRYDHVVQVLNGKKPLTGPFLASLKMYQLLYDRQNSINPDGISKSIIANMRKHFCNETEREFLSDPVVINTYKNEWDFAWGVIYDILKSTR